MSLMKQPAPQPGRVQAAVRLLSAVGNGMPSDSVARLLQPDELVRTQDGTFERGYVKVLISECIRSGLFVETKDRLDLSPGLKEMLHRNQRVEEVLPDYVVSNVLAAEEDKGLGMAIAWYLDRDILEAPATWNEVSAALAHSPLFGVLELNDVRFRAFSSWARYLGCAVFMSGSGPGARLLPDPTALLGRILPRILPQTGSTMGLVQCMREVAKVCPLFEGGHIRDSVAVYTSRLESELSSTTSHALLRLLEDGRIVLGYHADADSWLLVDGQDKRRFSEIGLVQLSQP